MDIEKLAREAGLAAYPDEIQRFADLVRRETAEEAAKVCAQTGLVAAEMYGDEAECLSTTDLCASAIRERFKA